MASDFWTLPEEPAPELAALEDAILAALAKGALPAHRAGAMLHQIDAHEWLRVHGYLEPMRGPQMPADRPPELVAEQKRIAARWRELSAQSRVRQPGHHPPDCPCGLSDQDVRLIDNVFGYRPTRQQEAESC